MAIRLLRDRSPQQHDFPWMMYEILETAAKRNEEHIVSWVDDGKGFKIHNRELFVERYMKKMTKMSKYKSFQRQVNFWGFESRYYNRGMKNPGIYYHNDFVRGQPQRLEALKRVPPATSRKKKWNHMYERLLDYVRKYHTSRVPLQYSEDRELARWVQEQRTLNVQMPRHFAKEIERLKKLPDWIWTSEEEADTAKVLASLGKGSQFLKMVDNSSALRQPLTGI